MDDKLDQILNHISEIRVELAEIRLDLNHHIRRTDELQKIVEDELPPIKQHVDRVKFVFLALAYLLGASTAIGAALEWLKSK